MQAERRAAQIDSSLQPCHGFNLPSDKVGTSMTPSPPLLAVAKTHLRTRPECLFSALQQHKAKNEDLMASKERFQNN